MASDRVGIINLLLKSMEAVQAVVHLHRLRRTGSLPNTPPFLVASQSAVSKAD